MIPLSSPELNGKEWEYIKDCLDSGWVSSAGRYVDRFEEEVARFTGMPYAVATNTGTAALHISLLVAGVQADDYVIVPDLTFVASVNAIRYTGANPILIDADKDSWQMDPDLLENFLSSETQIVEGSCRLKKNNRRVSALMPVHVLGGIGDMKRLAEIADAYHLKLIEDATEALGSTFGDHPAGSIGHLGCFSFNGNKVMTTGGGGMIVTGDKALADRTRHLTTQAKSKPEEYYHDETGYNYRMVNILAAMGVAQMEQLPSFIEKKKKIASFYLKELKDTGDICFQQHHEHCQSNEWLFTIRTSRREALMHHLRAEDILSRPLWVPMHQLPMHRSDILITEENYSKKLHEECLSLPCSSGISDAEMEKVAGSINAFFS